MRRFAVPLSTACAAALVGLGVISRELNVAGWLAAVTYAAVLVVLVGRGLAATGAPRLGAANAVTLTRAVLIAPVVGLAVSGGSTRLLAALAAVAILLDFVDGQVARRWSTPTELGSRFDMEVDAFLILVLSLTLVDSLGWWVALIGLARYLLWAATLIWPWLSDPTPPRRWAKVVAALTGLTLVAALVLPQTVASVLLAIVLVLLVESFGQQVYSLLSRDTVTWPRWGSLVSLTVATWVLFAALALPHELEPHGLAYLGRVPPEPAVLLVASAFLARPLRRLLAWLAGALLGALTAVKLLDIGFDIAFDRPSNLLTDGYYVKPGYELLRDTSGPGVALAAAVGAAVALLVAVVLPWWATVRVSAAAAQWRRTAVIAAGVVLLGSAVTWVGAPTLDPAVDKWPTTATADVWSLVTRTQDGLEDRKVFARALEVDPLSEVPPDQLFAKLRGKDVLLVFVESYGQTALEGTSYSDEIRSLVLSRQPELEEAGWHLRSGWLTSPTAGGASWLAHSTLQTGLWVDSQQRYNQLMVSERESLTSLFGAAGWRTVFTVPANTEDWLEGPQFYDIDQLYDSRNVGYQGRKYGYTRMPDQYTLSAFDRLEFDVPGRGPLMAEIDLLSSHHPWTSRPPLVDWELVGDGSIFEGKAIGGSKDDVFDDNNAIKDAYTAALSYSLTVTFDYLVQHGDDDLVVVLLGDHQPHSYVAGDDATRDVPITVLATDPAVIAEIESWDWVPGLVPDGAPVWGMDEFRDQFVAAMSEGMARPAQEN